MINIFLSVGWGIDKNSSFLFITKEKVDIAFLQETHVDNMALGNEIAKILNGKIIRSFSHPRGKGVGIFISNTLSVDIHH